MTAERSRPWQGAADVNGDADGLTLPLPADKSCHAAPVPRCISPDHARLLEESAIPLDVAMEAGVYSACTVDSRESSARTG